MCEARIEELLVEIRERPIAKSSVRNRPLQNVCLARNIRSLKIGPVRVADQETALRRRLAGVADATRDGANSVIESL
jgi:hypothetical protein